MAKVSDLIELIQSHPCFYNTKGKSYHDRNMKSKAISDICTKLKVSGKQKVDLLGSEPARGWLPWSYRISLQTILFISAEAKVTNEN